MNIATHLVLSRGDRLPDASGGVEAMPGHLVIAKQTAAKIHRVEGGIEGTSGLDKVTDAVGHDGGESVGDTPDVQVP